MIVAFNPELNLDRIIIQRGFAHSVKQLTSLDYFTWEQITCIDQSLIKMLKDMAFEVAKNKDVQIVYGKCFLLQVPWLKNLF